MKILFCGTGTSGCVPSIACLLNPAIGCKVCPHAHNHRSQSHNHRLNTSILLSVPTNLSIDGPPCTTQPPRNHVSNILIDCGKTFLWQSLELFPKHGINRIDALLLTHPHADAILGLDDLRGWTLNSGLQSNIQIYCDKFTFDYISIVFPYMIDVKFASGGGDVPSLVFHILEVESVSDEDGFSIFKPFSINGVSINPFHVQHGQFNQKPFYSCGYAIDDLVYISDVSKVPPLSMEILARRKWDVIIVDALHDKPHPSHFSFRESLEFLFSLRPHFGFFTGFTHRVDQWYMQHCVDEIVKKFNDDINLEDEDYLCLNYEKQRDVVELQPNDLEWESSRFFVKLAWDGLLFELSPSSTSSTKVPKIGILSS